MVSADQIQLAVAMLGWKQAELFAYIEDRVRSDPGLQSSATWPGLTETDIEARREDEAWVVTTAPLPELSASSPEARFFVAALERRSRSLEAFVRELVEVEEPITDHAMADRLGWHVSIVRRIVDGPRIRIAGEMVRASERILCAPSGPSRSARFEAMLAPCTDHYGLGDPSRYEWPNNVLSVKTVVYEGGWIAREDDLVVPGWCPDELAACERLADEAAAILEGVPVGMGSEADTTFAPFYRVADRERGDVPDSIDEGFVREMFGGTLSPWDPVVIEPLSEGGAWWAAMTGEGVDPTDVERWRALVTFLHDGLFHPTFVSIGSFEYAPALPIPATERPEVFASRGSCLPRMAFAMTSGGSVVGVFGYVVWT